MRNQEGESERKNGQNFRSALQGTGGAVSRELLSRPDGSPDSCYAPSSVLGSDNSEGETLEKGGGPRSTPASLRVGAPWLRSPNSGLTVTLGPASGPSDVLSSGPGVLFPCIFS